MRAGGGRALVPLQLAVGGVEPAAPHREDEVEAAVVREGDVLAGVARVALAAHRDGGGEDTVKLC